MANRKQCSSYSSPYRPSQASTPARYLAYDLLFELSTSFVLTRTQQKNAFEICSKTFFLLLVLKKFLDPPRGYLTSPKTRGGAMPCEYRADHSTCDIQQYTRNRIFLEFIHVVRITSTPMLETHDLWLHIGVLLYPAHVFLNLFSAS